MKKLFHSLLLMAARMSVRRSTNTQTVIDARITEGLDRWIAEKGFCRPDSGLDSVAEIINVNREALSYYCRTVLNVKFLSWRKQLRINEACRIMRENPEISFSDVSLLVGIPDRTNFRRQFFEVTGLTPADFLGSLSCK